MIIESDIIQVGQYNKPHGINGEISATFSREIDLSDKANALISPIGGIFVPFFAESVRTKGVDTFLLKIDGITSEERVRLLVNQPIYVLKDKIPENDEVYCDYFIGYYVFNNEHQIGRIIDVDDTTENALFIVEEGSNQYLIPISEDFISDIDEDKKRINMNLPDGILDI